MYHKNSNKNGFMQLLLDMTHPHTYTLFDEMFQTVTVCAIIQSDIKSLGLLSLAFTNNQHTG